MAGREARGQRVGRHGMHDARPSDEEKKVALRLPVVNVLLALK